MRFDPKKARRVWKHWPRIRLRKTLASRHLIKDFGVTTRQIDMSRAFVRCVPEIGPSFDDLFAGASADTELQPSTGESITRFCFCRAGAGLKSQHVMLTGRCRAAHPNESARTNPGPQGNRLRGTCVCMTTRRSHATVSGKIGG